MSYLLTITENSLQQFLKTYNFGKTVTKTTKEIQNIVTDI